MMLPAPFSMLSDEAQSPVTLLAHDPLFHLGDKPQGFFYVQSGEVHLMRYGRDGEAIVIHRAFTGECFAEASLFSETYHCDAVAVMDSQIVRLDKALTLEWLNNNPAFSQAFNAHLARQVQFLSPTFGAKKASALPKNVSMSQSRRVY